MERSKEVWKDVKNYEGLYTMSTHGRLKSFHRSPEGILLKGKLNKNGYNTYMLSKEGFCKTMIAHKLMWETFVGEIPEGKSVDHINSERLCNFLDNFQLLTQAEQIHKEQSDLIRAEHPSGVKIEEWGTRAIKKVTGICRAKIMKALKHDGILGDWKFTIIKKHSK